MDPSYSNSFNGTNPGGMNPGGVGTTPGNVPNQMGQVPQTNLTPQMNLGGFPGNNLPVSSGAGDIVLNGGGQKQTKKWLMVVGLIALVGVIIAVVVLLLHFSVPSQPSGQFSAQRSFEQYYNYYFYGDSGTEQDSNSIENFYQTSFAIETKDENIEARNAYFTNLRNYYDDFYSIYVEEVEEDKKAIELANDYKNKIDLITYYNGGFSVNRQSITDAYVGNGDQGVEELIKITLAPYENIGSIFGMNYYDLAIKYVKATKDLIKMYESFGCIKDKDIDYMCASQNVNDQTKQLNDEIAELYSDMHAIVVNCKEDSFSDMFSFRDRLQNSGVNSQQESING